MKVKVSVQKFTVFIPSLNSQTLILGTLESIKSAAFFAKDFCTVNVVILDGNSQDQTISLVNGWLQSIEERSFFNLEIYSKSDKSLYDALSNRLPFVKEGIVSYLNCGDLYEINTFEILTKVFKDDKINWVTGINQYIDRKNYKNIYNVFVYRKELIRRGVYGRFPLCPVIQQESTFWRANLMGNINRQTFSEFKLAGDFYIWFHLSIHYDLISLKIPLATFVFHENQLSRDTKGYLQEVKKVRYQGFTFYYLILLFDLFSYRFNLRYLSQAKYIYDLD